MEESEFKNYNIFFEKVMLKFIFFRIYFNNDYY